MNYFKATALSLFGTIMSLSAKMVFETKLVVIEANPDEIFVTGEFPFEVTGDGETIISYDALCSCLAGRVEPLLPDRSAKLNWKAGEKGVIKARFDTSRFLGTVDKAIELKLEGEKDPIHLIVRVNVPELVQLKPSTLKWDKGSEAKEKVIKVKINHTDPIKILSHAGNNEKAYPYELKIIKEGWEYEIRVKPTDTSQSGIGMISLRTDSKIGKFKRATAYVTTKPKLKMKPLTEARK
jgi:hypothetical protein